MKTSVKKYVKAIMNLLIALVILLAVIFLAPKVLIFFMPFVIAWIIAMIASPMARFFEEKLKIKRKAGSVVVIVVVLGIVILAVYLIGSKLIRELIGFIDDLPQMWDSLQADFNEIAENLDIFYRRLPKDVQNTWNKITAGASEWIGNFISSISTPTLAAVGNFAMQLPTVIIGIIMCLLGSYFFVAEKEQMTEVLQKVMPESVLLRFRQIKGSLFKAVGGYFKAQLKIEIWIYLLLVIGFLILGIDHVLLISLGVAVMDFLPFFGTGTIMVPWAIVEFMSSDYKMTIGILLIWGVSQLVRQIIQPKIVGDSIGVAPIPTLFLLYIGYMLGGVLGMIVAVPLGLIIWTLYKEGAFDTTKNSVRILVSGMNHFRKLTPQDMAIVHSHKRECEEELLLQKMQEETDEVEKDEDDGES